MNFLGLDLSLTGSGIVEVDALGMATQVVRQDVPRRPPWAAYKEMRMLVGKLVQKPDRPMTAAIESPLLRGNGALERAGMWGAVVSLLGNCTVVVAPAQLKKFATGDHVAKKDRVRLAVYKRWGFEDESNDVVDAFVQLEPGSRAWTRTRKSATCATVQPRPQVSAAPPSDAGTVVSGGESPRSTSRVAVVQLPAVIVTLPEFSATRMRQPELSLE